MGSFCAVSFALFVLLLGSNLDISGYATGWMATIDNARRNQAVENTLIHRRSNIWRGVLLCLALAVVDGVLVLRSDTTQKIGIALAVIGVVCSRWCFSLSGQRCAAAIRRLVTFPFGVVRIQTVLFAGSGMGDLQAG